MTPRGDEAPNSSVWTVDALAEAVGDAPIAVHCLAPDGTILWANAAELRLLGYSVEEYIGRPMAGFHTGPKPVEDLLERLRSGESLQGYEARLRAKDGSTRYVLMSADIVRHKGDFLFARVFCSDITERTAREEALRTETQACAATSPLKGLHEDLLRVSAGLTAELDLERLVQRLTDEARVLCRAQFGAFFDNTTGGADGRFVPRALSGVPREAFANYPEPCGAGIFASTFGAGEVVRLADLTTDPRHRQSALPHGVPAGHPRIRSYLGVPVRSRGGEVFGGLFFGHVAPDVFTAEDERVLLGVASVAAVAIDNARLYREARCAERSAEREKARLHHLFMHAPAIICIQRGPEHVCEFVNPAAQRLLGGRAVVGLPLRTVFPEVPTSVTHALNTVYRTGERHFGTEEPAVLDWDGTGRPYEKFFNFVYEPDRDPSGAIEGVMFFGFEVTDQVLARRMLESVVKELEISSRTKDEFLATVSHELRTPLNAILGWVRMLRSGSLPDNRRERALETIERNANAQTQLIEDLLDVSRIISGKLRLEVGLVDLPHIVDGAVEALRPAADAREVSIRQTMDPNASPILGDADRLQQIVWNLLSNAVKFTPKGGKIQVVVRRKESSVEILVHDNGQGIDPAFLPHVFERFRQADGTTTRTHGGLGLGLAIVRHLVELHGGTVYVESEGLGKGSCFIVTLPMSPVRSSSVDQLPALRLVSTVPDLHCPPELDGVHVLVVDDEQDARDLLVQVLTPCKAVVSVAASVAEAFQLVQQKRPDVVVSDIGMPGEDGYVLIKKIRELPADRGGRTPAVALTAYARIEDRTKALVAGFNMHVPKPVEPAELLVVLVSLTSLFPRGSG